MKNLKLLMLIGKMIQDEPLKLRDEDAKMGGEKRILFRCILIIGFRIPGLFNLKRISGIWNHI